jgi:hypothetical protein
MTLMKTILISLALLTVVSCKKSPQSSACQCYEHHEALETNGTFGMSWNLDHETTPASDFCDKDNGAWTYYSNDTKRYRTICQ